MRQLRRRWYLVALGAVAAPVVGASLAYACTSLATLTLSPTQGPAGQQVTVTGRGFSAHDASDVRTGLVEIRFDSLNSPALTAPVRAAADGSFTAQVTIPQNAAPGTHVLIATQNRANGTPASGTPARQAFTVTQSPRAVANAQPSTGGPTGATAQAPAAAGAPAAAIPGGAAAPAVVPGSSASGQTSSAAAPAAQGGVITGGPGSAAPGVAVNPAESPSAFGAPASAPAVGPRSMMTPSSGPSPLMAGLLVAAGLILSLGGAAMVIAGRRSSGAALARR